MFLWVLECQCIKNQNVTSCNNMQFWNPTWHSTHCLDSWPISMFFVFSCSHILVFSKFDPTYLWILIVVNVLHIFQNLSFFNVVWILWVVWFEFCVKHKYTMPKPKHLCLLVIFKFLYILMNFSFNFFFKSFVATDLSCSHTNFNCPNATKHTLSPNVQPIICF
jgi:hypothetical protein